jgi:hypothetical protein
MMGGEGEAEEEEAEPGQASTLESVEMLCYKPT